MKQLTDQLSAIPQIKIHPIQWNAQNHAFVECGLPKTSFDSLFPIFTALPDRYIIDTNIFI